jgi:hypothetical protein
MWGRIASMFVKAITMCFVYGVDHGDTHPSIDVFNAPSMGGTSRTRMPAVDEGNFALRGEYWQKNTRMRVTLIRNASELHSLSSSSFSLHYTNTHTSIDVFEVIAARLFMSSAVGQFVDGSLSELSVSSPLLGARYPRIEERFSLVYSLTGSFTAGHYPSEHIDRGVSVSPSADLDLEFVVVDRGSPSVEIDPAEHIDRGVPPHSSRELYPIPTRQSTGLLVKSVLRGRRSAALGRER